MNKKEKRAERKEKENFLQEWTVKGSLKRIRNTALEAACLDAEHRSIEKKGPLFRDICRDYCDSMIDSYTLLVVDFIEENGEPPYRSVNVPIISGESLKTGIMSRYGSAHWKDYLVPGTDESEAEWHANFNDLVHQCNKAYSWGDKE